MGIFNSNGDKPKTNVPKMNKAVLGEAIPIPLCDNSKRYEVTFSVVCHAENVGHAIRRAQQVLAEGAANVKNVVEIKNEDQFPKIFTPERDEK